MQWSGRKSAALSVLIGTVGPWAFDTFLKPIIGLNVESWATRRGLGDLSATAPDLPPAGPLVTAAWEAAEAAYAFAASGYGLAFAAGCVFIAFFDWLTWPYRMLRRFRRSGGFFGPVRWDYRGFIGLTADDWTNLRVVGFQAHGRNRTAKPLLKVEGCIRSETTNQEIPLQLNLGGDPVPPERTYAIPARASFIVVCMTEQSPEPNGNDRAQHADHFLSRFGGFTFVFRADGREWNYRFPYEEVAGFVRAWRAEHLEKPGPPGPVRRTLH